MGIMNTYLANLLRVNELRCPLDYPKKLPRREAVSTPPLTLAGIKTRRTETERIFEMNEYATLFQH